MGAEGNNQRPFRFSTDDAKDTLDFNASNNKNAAHLMGVTIGSEAFQTTLKLKDPMSPGKGSEVDCVGTITSLSWDKSPLGVFEIQGLISPAGRASYEAAMGDSENTAIVKLKLGCYEFYEDKEKQCYFPAVDAKETELEFNFAKDTPENGVEDQMVSVNGMNLHPFSLYLVGTNKGGQEITLSFGPDLKKVYEVGQAQG